MPQKKNYLAFDTVRQEMLMVRLREIGVDGANLRVLTNLYWGQKTLVRTEDDRNGWTEITR